MRIKSRPAQQKGANACLEPIQSVSGRVGQRSATHQSAPAYVVGALRLPPTGIGS